MDFLKNEEKIRKYDFTYFNIILSSRNNLLKFVNLPLFENELKSFAIFNTPYPRWFSPRTFEIIQRRMLAQPVTMQRGNYIMHVKPSRGWNTTFRTALQPKKSNFLTSQPVPLYFDRANLRVIQRVSKWTFWEKSLNEISDEILKYSKNKEHYNSGDI